MAGINSKDFILRTVKSILTSLTTVVLVNVNKWISDKKKKEKERKKRKFEEKHYRLFHLRAISFVFFSFY